jgi:hypothetical protein
LDVELEGERKVGGEDWGGCGGGDRLRSGVGILLRCYPRGSIWRLFAMITARELLERAAQMDDRAMGKELLKMGARVQRRG